MIYLQLVRLLFLSGVGVCLGVWLSRQKRTWVLGYIIPVSLALVFAACCWFPTLGFYPPFRLLLAWPRKLVIMLFGISVLFSVLIPKLPNKASRKYVVFFSGICILYFSAALLMPTLLHDSHMELHNTAAESGVCRQSTAYTCGPASTVSALAHYGIHAEEGEMAIRTHCTPLFGTQAEEIARVVNRHYASRGVVAHHRYFDSLALLPKDVPVVIAVRFSFLIDHFIVVRHMDDGTFEILDPIAGRSIKTEAQLRSIWRRYGIIISKSN